MLHRSICHQVSNQGDELALLAIILSFAAVSPTYSTGLPHGNVVLPRIAWNLLITRNKSSITYKDKNRETGHHVVELVDSMPQENRRSVK